MPLYDVLKIHNINMSMYAIFWKYLDDSWLISESGNGDFCLNLEDATKLCTMMNLKYKNKIHHWYVLNTFINAAEDPVNY
jgi:hypothetical protein